MVTRQTMYMRAEARRQSEQGEQGVVASAPALPRRHRHPRRRQLLVLSALWLLIVAITIVVGLRWSSPAKTPVIAASTPPASADVPALTPAPTPAPVAPPRTAASATPRQLPVTKPSVAKAKASEVAPAAVVTEAAPRPAAAANGRLVITTTPAGAHVTVDGVGWGATPLTIRYLPGGMKRVRITMDGYASQERTVRVDGPTTMRVVLSRRSGAARAR